MEEVSSLDSFHTDDVEDSASVEKTDDKTNEQVNDEFEPVSSVETFDNDDNSASAGAAVSASAADDAEAEADNDNDNEAVADAEAEGEAEAEAEADAEAENETNEEGAEVEKNENTDSATVGEESVETETDAAEAENEANETSPVEEDEASAGFEEVDASVTAVSNNSNAADESDMLGDNDMTLGGNDETKSDMGVEVKSATPMEVDNDDDEVVDTEMASNHSSSSTSDKNKNETLSADRDMSVDGTAEEEEARETAEVDEEVAKEKSDDADHDGKDIPDGVEPEQNSTSLAEDKPEENDEDEGEHGADPVENVQEPEESDVCLIPDDTETEVTEAEKEQAILARENAEKEEQENEQSKPSQFITEVDSETATNEDNLMEKAEDKSTNDVDESSKKSAATTTTTEDAEAPEEDVPNEATNNKIIIAWIVPAQKLCKKCGVEKTCGYRYKVATTNVENETTSKTKYEYICTQECCDELIAENVGKYFIRRKKFLIEEVNAANTDINTEESSSTETISKEINECLQCNEQKACKYFFKQDEEHYHICSDSCFEALNSIEPDKFKLKRHSIRVRNIGATILTPKKMTAESRDIARTTAEADAARQERVSSFTRRCAECLLEITLGDKNLLWESMDFCNEVCLGKYQRKIGSNCATCQGEVPHQALGKYCVRFGFDVRQFCCAACLNEYKKGLKTCSCCQKDISKGNEGFLAPVGDKEQFKDFCSQNCLRRYDNMCNPKKKQRTDFCAVCNNEQPVRVEIVLDNKEYNFCSNPCFSAFKFVSNIVADQCGMCCKYFERKGSESFTIYTERRAKVFCTKICMNVYIIVHRSIVSCQWCKVKKYNFDMILNQRDGQDILLCSLNCLTLYGVSVNAFTRTVIKCDNCNKATTPQYHLTMSDASMRNFCTYQCVMQFQNQFSHALILENEPSSNNQASSSTKKLPQSDGTPFPTGLPKRIKLRTQQNQNTAVSFRFFINTGLDGK